MRRQSGLRPRARNNGSLPHRILLRFFEVLGRSEPEANLAG